LSQSLRLSAFCAVREVFSARFSSFRQEIDEKRRKSVAKKQHVDDNLFE
jgi:hypothetical protein